MEISVNGIRKFVRHDFQATLSSKKISKLINEQNGNQHCIPLYARLICLKPVSTFILPILIFLFCFATGFLHAQANPQKQVLQIQVVSPSPDKPCKNLRPMFEWKMGSPIKGVSYTITLRELQDNVSLDKGNIIFEKKGIIETNLKFPSDARQLDSSKVYFWTVSAYDTQNNLLGKSILSPVVISDYFNFCIFGAMAEETNLCLGSSPHILFIFIQFPGSGPTHWTLSNGQSGDINTWGYDITITPAPLTIGPVSYTLTVHRGNCTKVQNLTFYIYPVLHEQILSYPALTPITEICIGDDAQLNLQGLPAGFTVIWEWSDASATGPWTNLGSGNPMNTSIISPSTCTCPSRTRWFRATASGGGLTSSAPADCPLQLTIPLTIWCQTIPGTITVAGGNNICALSYPVHVNLSLSGNCGTVQSWTRNPASIPPSPGATSILDNITTAGYYTYSVVVRNGICSSISTSTTIHVEDPITASITCTPTEVCPNDDAILTVTHSGGTEPLTIQWQYQMNCTGGWTYSGVTGNTQNTNPIGSLGPYGIPLTSLCWRAIITSASGTCPPCTTSTATISVIQPPYPPTITLVGGSLPKCPGTPVTLHATPNLGTGPFTWQWYRDGEILPGEINQNITATQPGNYIIVVHNYHNCDSASAIYEVKDCIINLAISGPCTSNGSTAITLTAIASSTCGAPYTYHWSTGATTQSITVTPTSTTEYCVTVTDGHGCSNHQCITIKICP